jgi:hypothetical protein
VLGNSGAFNRDTKASIRLRVNQIIQLSVTDLGTEVLELIAY